MDFAVFITQKLGNSNSSRSLAASEPALLSARSLQGPSDNESVRGGKAKSVSGLQFNKKLTTNNSSLSLITSRSSSSAARNFIERNRETSVSSTAITAEDAARIEALLGDPKNNPESIVESDDVTSNNNNILELGYDSMAEYGDRINEIDESLERFRKQRNASTSENQETSVVPTVVRGDAVVQEQREKREITTRMSEINHALKVLNDDQYDFSDTSSTRRPGTSDSRSGCISVAPEEISNLVKQAKEEVEDRASKDDIERLLVQISLDSNA